jgi:hypothetical protein
VILRLLIISTWSFALLVPAICAETAASGEARPYLVLKDTASVADVRVAKDKAQAQPHSEDSN